MCPATGAGVAKLPEPSAELSHSRGQRRVCCLLPKRKAPLYTGLFFYSGGRIRTCDLRVMSPTSYRTAPPRAVWKSHYTTLQHIRLVCPRERREQALPTHASSPARPRTAAAPALRTRRTPPHMPPTPYAASLPGSGAGPRPPGTKSQRYGSCGRPPTSGKIGSAGPPSSNLGPVGIHGLSALQWPIRMNRRCEARAGV